MTRALNTTKGLVCRLKGYQFSLAILTTLLLAVFSSNLNAAVVKSMRFWQSPESTRVVLDLSSEVEHQIKVLKGPDRIVIDIAESSVAVDLSQLEINSSLIKKVRKSKPAKAGDLRLVLDLAKAATPKSFSLKPYQDYGDRLVIDLLDDKKQSLAQEKPKKEATKKQQRDIIIAIDAGHGGEDPGARGPTGAREKKITLALAQALAKEINKEKGLKAILTRSGDYYLSLRKRTAIARQHRADLFVSVHADSFTNKKARGASVWILSTRGATSEAARWLKKQEADSELLGGVNSNVKLSEYDKPIAEVLLDLQMSHSIEASLTLGKEVHRKIAKVAPKMHKNHVEKNSFVVLKNPDIPSILVESGFISNPQEEKLLKTKNYRNKLAKAVKDGIKNYFKSNAPDGTYYAATFRQNIYRVRRGDNLSKVAHRFDVSIKDLKLANNLKSNTVRIGQKLIIPTAN
ncbi:N-acetylmuramoyl-L-alanine amidase [Kangiella sp. TOML190]|uniref:N-acetylmuramoyl-L-alanine amidase n=1 Tax=Kangiella sp. TOML190 TaxID=2931351 RepID=UPI00204149D3|nr:N-acetylmuramoyl-L-alanine amidase [Kangiella sp. TOML190]